MPFLFVCCHTLVAQNIQNPVLPGVADAGVMKYNGKYYIGGVYTNGDFYVSEDLLEWGAPVHVVSIDNEWIKGSGVADDQIHANDMRYLNGDFHLYWSVNYWGRDRHAVHVVHAQSQDVLGPYSEPDRKSWMDNRIDPMVFRDDDGQLYMYMVRFTDGNTIWARKMKNPAEFAGEPVCLFASLPDTWETMDNRVAEGPWVIKYRDRYYMMYNANHTSTGWGNYQLGVAEADSPLGFQHGNKYSYPLVGSNQTQLEEQYVDLLRYSHNRYEPLFNYTENKPATGWTTITYDASAWQQGESGFASQKVEGSTTRHQGTVWNSSDLWLRKTFVAGNQVGNLALRVAHDGDTRIYLNETLIYEKQGRDYGILNLDKKLRSALKNGTNLLAVETKKGRSCFFDVSLFDMKGEVADDILMTPGQPNILRGPNGFEWWLIYMANKNNERRGQYIDRVQFFDKTMYVDGITGPRTPGYHPEPALPTFSQKEETPSFGALQHVQASTTYLFEAAVKTKQEAGVIAWWKDSENYAHIGLDAGTQSWYLYTRLQGKETKETYALPADFRWGVYHHLRVERQAGCLQIWLDEMPAPGKSVFHEVVPEEAGLPGVFDKSDDALFEGVTYTIGFDNIDVQLPERSEALKGDWLNDYEFSFQLSSLPDQGVAGCYPVYVDEKNYVKAQFNAVTGKLEVIAMKKGKQAWREDFSLAHRQTIYPDVKYTDFIEKTYRFATPTRLDALYLSRHEAGDKSAFVEDMFSKFTIDYLRNGEWHPIDNQGAAVAEHPAYNRLAFAPVKAEAIRFTNKEAEDLQRHIYTIGIHELLKESYHFRAVRRGEKLYLFVDGRELELPEIQYPASRVGFCSDNYNPVYKGILYYHIRNK
ncbi:MULTISPECIES: family 43 glycosylhydrolase [unclassified Parabacteroides]|uniref:family 43 glycosylhydrolase n=1 Tax=unclassified Parabacteroides TaxID=2649774 RepID=UPI0024733F18|nr:MULTISPECIES: family 43 glycosylhydrolase [unclassified Parabacteroides]